MTPQSNEEFLIDECGRNQLRRHIKSTQVELSDIGPHSIGLSVARDVLTREPFPKVYIALVPTDDATTIPALLHWGNWNACPAPEYHVAALRHWRDVYGAEIVGLGRDTVNLKVARRPTTRDEAIELARIQYAYCADIVDQGCGSYRVLAAGLMADDWWFFWWD